MYNFILFNNSYPRLFKYSKNNFSNVTFLLKICHNFFVHVSSRLLVGKIFIIEIISKHEKLKKNDDATSTCTLEGAHH